MDDRSFLSAWWRRSLQRRGPVRSVSLGLLGTAALGNGGCAAWLAQEPSPELVQQRDEFDIRVDALDLQRRHGWAVGVEPGDLELSPMALPGASVLDVDGGVAWRERIMELPSLLSPGQAALMPYYVPTLFQSLVAPGSVALRAVIRPMHTDEMELAFGRGQAILSLFSQVRWPRDTMVIVDLPGPEAVAVAAAMASDFEPVFTFGNWPHPVGVVPAHETLAASLYYAPLLERSRAKRVQGAPAVLVLDANRLAPYGDDSDQFDNRYLAKIPSVAGLRALGVKHVLYVTARGEQAQELDDLNESFVELEQSAIEVRALGMSEIERTAGDPAEALAAIDPLPGDDEPAVEDDGWTWASAGIGFYWLFGGSLGHHCHFWDQYGWYRPHGRPARVAAPPTLAMRAQHASGYRPAMRATVFAGGQTRAAGVVSAYRPSGFGAMTIHASRASGHVTSVGGRGGSFGRVSGWGGG